MAARKKRYANMHEQVTLGRKVAALRAQDPPMGFREIGQELGRPASTVRDIHKRFMEAGDPDRALDPMEPITEHLELLTQVQIRASEAIDDAEAGSPALIGALKLIVDTSERRLEMMRVLGVLPTQLGALSAERRMQEMFREFAELAREHEASDDLVTAMLALAERRVAVPVIEGRAVAA